MTLSETWFMEGYIDFELQKYKLLAYLQEVNKLFSETRLYPPLSDIVFHYNNIISFRDNKQFLQDQFPKRLNGMDLQKLELTYEKILGDDSLMQELEQITGFAEGQMKNTIENGAEIYELVEQHLRIEPVGIIPLYKDEGYMLLRYGNIAEVRAYAYTTTLLEHKNARYRGIKLSYLDTWPGNITNTYEQIKRDIIRTIKTLPNPAVYSIEHPMQLPLDETLLPVAKRVLVKHLV
jgi:hypothetical protein